MLNTQIIVAGAGPTGLLAAATLVKNGIQVRVFEKEKQRSEYSRALVIHAGILEYLEIVHPDLLKKFLSCGKRIREMHFGEKYKIDLSLIPSGYNFLLVIEQEETEKILEDYLIELGGQVERGYSIIDAKNHQDQVTATIQTDNEKFSVTADYLIDCSGAHSIIRKEVLEIPFIGEKYFGRLVMGDIKVNSKIRDDIGQATANQNGIAAFVPLKEKSYFRVILISHSDEEIPEKITIDYFRNLAKKIAPKIELSEKNKWLASFELSRRMVSQLRAGRIFLAGDSAHVHSPVGGQGMNLGMQDALNISLKLKRVLVNKDNVTLLDNYEKERLPIIAEILKTTNSAMRSGVEKSFLSLVKMFLLKKIFAPILFRSKFMQRELLTVLSQIRSARKEIGSMRL